MLLWLVVQGIGPFLRPTNVSAGVATLCFVGVVGSLIVMMLSWLNQAVKVAPMVREQRQQYEAQRWQHYQQQIAHRQGASPAGQAYSAPPPAPPPPDAPQPPTGPRDPGGPPAST
jgi:hypothetical protein